MNPLRRVVIDTSTLVSAVLRAESIPRKALLSAVNSFELCVSQDTLLELQEVLGRPKFDRYASLQTRMEFLGLVTQWSRLCEVNAAAQQAAMGACRDARDDKFLALAMASDAVVIVSSDQDLLTLGTWQGIRIVTPADFAATSIAGE